MSDIWQLFIDSLALNNSPAPLLTDAVYPLSAHRFIDVNGIDAAKFLQGQLSCDLQQISLGQSGLGSHSNAKGRMQSSFRICRYTENGFLLRVHHSIQEQAKNALAKYIVFSKATISINKDWVGIGLHGKKARQDLSRLFSHIPDGDFQQCIENNCIVICSSAEKHSYEIYTQPEKAIELCKVLSSDLPFCNSEQHHLLENHLGLAFVETGTFDAFIPQMYNYQCTPAISFKKGCYTGQEIVARMHYLGKIKRHMRHYTAECAIDIQAGDAVFKTEGEQSVGDIVSAVKIGNTAWDLLINLTDEAATQHELRTPQAALTEMLPLALPYTLE
jgi:tRNA-modifying protein YgfZ